MPGNSVQKYAPKALTPEEARHLDSLAEEEEMARLNTEWVDQHVKVNALLNGAMDDSSTLPPELADGVEGPPEVHPGLDGEWSVDEYDASWF